MISLVISLDIHPRQRDQFLAVMEQNARSSRREPGCLRFDVCQNADDLNLFLLYEIYADEAALDAHRSSPHFARWQAAAKECVRTRSDFLGHQLWTDVEAPLEASGSDHPWLLLRAGGLASFDRGTGVTTLPYVGRWNRDANRVTTGRTVFEVGKGVPLHTHNVEETVIVLRGDALAVIEDESLTLTVGDATWVAPGVPHRFANRGSGPLEIYWVYGGRNVTRTICATGETVTHLSDRDRGTTSEQELNG